MVPEANAGKGRCSNFLREHLEHLEHLPPLLLALYTHNVAYIWEEAQHAQGAHCSRDRALSTFPTGRTDEHLPCGSETAKSTLRESNPRQLSAHDEAEL